MNILGLSYMYHDSAACLLRDGEVMAAAAEERFLRIKHSVDFPARAIRYCLQEGGLNIDDIDAVVFYEKPYLKFERILKSHLMTFPFSYRSFRRFLPMWLNYKLCVPQIIREQYRTVPDVKSSARHDRMSPVLFFALGYLEAAYEFGLGPVRLDQCDHAFLTVTDEHAVSVGERSFTSHLPLPK